MFADFFGQWKILNPHETAKEILSGGLQKTIKTFYGHWLTGQLVFS